MLGLFGINKNFKFISKLIPVYFFQTQRIVCATAVDTYLVHAVVGEQLWVPYLPVLHQASAQSVQTLRLKPRYTELPHPTPTVNVNYGHQPYNPTSRNPCIEKKTSTCS